MTCSSVNRLLFISPPVEDWQSNWLNFRGAGQYDRLINSPHPDWAAAGWTDFEYWAIDGTYIYRMLPNAPKNSETKLNKTMFKWSDPNCPWS